MGFIAVGSMLAACGGRAAQDEASSSGAGGSSSGFTTGGAAAASGDASAGANTGGTNTGGTNTGGTNAGDAGVPSVCPDGVPSADEVAQTPRADQNLELLALKLTTGVVAEQADYDRVVRDMAAIRAQNPDLADIDFYSSIDGKSLLLEVSPDTAKVMLAGSYHAWDCLNQRYVAENISGLQTSSVTAMSVVLKGIYDTDRVAAQYALLPDVMYAQTGGYSGGDGPTICLTREDTLWHYVLDRAGGDCASGCNTHEYHHFTTTADGTLASLGSLTPDQVTSYASRDACH